jgi:hypothetical protein
MNGMADNNDEFFAIITDNEDNFCYASHQYDEACFN